MDLNTNLSIAVFNVVKYFIVFIVFDIVVRRSLDKIIHFFRRLSLSHGRSVPLRNSRIDRYNLPLRSLMSSHSLFLFLLTFTAYVVEFTLEFSSNSIVNYVSVPGVVNVINATHKTCPLIDITYRSTGTRMAQLADDCIDVDDKENMYTFYRYVWEKTEFDESFPRCIRTDDNILVKDRLLYSRQNLHPDAIDLVEDIRAGSVGANGDIFQAVISIQVSSKDVIFNRAYDRFGRKYVTGIFATKLANKPITCFGNVYGRVGEGQMKVQVSSCLEGSMPFPADSRFIFLLGSGRVVEDAADMKSKPWTTNIACISGRVVANVAEGIGKAAFFSTETYATFIGSKDNRDDVSLQRYAALYKNCEHVRVPRNISESRKQIIPNAKALPVVRVTIKRWALILIVSWPIALVLLSSMLGVVGNCKNMPHTLFGEHDIANRWLHEKNRALDIEMDASTYEEYEENEPSEGRRKRSRVKGKKPLYLSVKVGEPKDDVTVTATCMTVTRDASKPFEDLV